MLGNGEPPTTQLPRGYPVGCETSVRLADHRRVSIRPVLPTDATELAEAIRTADPETLRARFMGGPPPLTDEVLAQLTEVDYDRRFALVARDDKDRGVAIARYSALPADDNGEVAAEVAVAVDPEWRRVGLATVLIRLLARRAVECGIDRLSASFEAENRPVTELADEAHARVVVSQGVAELQINLRDIPADALAVPADEEGPGWPADLARTVLRTVASLVRLPGR
ncbi:MAG TPA: GNAT family N-acetyltransferase [Candidatus Eisenbacteria bacterium]|nr:GNAT family N-acetyltransferase [Candidatus Eisenbacteria bacterium]